MSGRSPARSGERDADRARFDEYCKRFYDPIVGWYVRRGVRPEEARELAQDVFTSAWKSLDRFRGDAHPKSWLFTIARNRFKNYLRDRKALKRDAPEVSMESMLEDRGSLPLRDDADEPPALGRVLEQEKRKVLAEGIRALPERMNACYRMHLGGELTYRQIGERLGIKENTVKSLTFQARRKLKEYVEEHAPELRLESGDPEGVQGGSS